jgi:hypothetical protein
MFFLLPVMLANFDLSPSLSMSNYIYMKFLVSIFNGGKNDEILTLYGGNKTSLEGVKI